MDSRLRKHFSRKNSGYAHGNGEMTGRSLVLLRHEVLDPAVQTLSRITGRNFVRSSELRRASVAEHLEQGRGLLLDKIGVAILPDLPPDVSESALEEKDHILAIEPERVVHALAASPRTTLEPQLPTEIEPPPASSQSRDYSRGYYAGVSQLVKVNQLLGQMLAGVGYTPVDIQEQSAFSEKDFTWGLQATRVMTSPYSGKGVRLAVLDTGLDLGHPDFANRKINPQSFVSGEAPQDGFGHGTHCIGIACGSKTPAMLPRYGIAYDSEIYAGKVLDNQGSGGDADILAGINWAVSNRCDIISMSLGARVMPGQPFSAVFEPVAQRALQVGTLIIAAAGNDSNREQGMILPVNHPANCPSIMAVAAIDSRFQIAFFSNGGLNPDGGQVDIVGPGVAVRSSWPLPVEYRTQNGTSMATPHVAGIAALWAEAKPGIRGAALWSLLLQQSQRMVLPARDVGAGLVQAPQ